MKVRKVPFEVDEKQVARLWWKPLKEPVKAYMPQCGYQWELAMKILTFKIGE